MKLEKLLEDDSRELMKKKLEGNAPAAVPAAALIAPLPEKPRPTKKVKKAPQKAEAELHWKPRFADLDSIVRTAWEWHRTHPHGYGGK